MPQWRTRQLMRPDKSNGSGGPTAKLLLNSLGRKLTAVRPLMTAEDLWGAFWEVFSETTNPCLRPTKLKGLMFPIF